jgi:alpha-tubulin suppressor-like RCC1 family protein
MVYKPLDTQLGLTMTAVAPCHDHTCGLDAAGAVHCWGRNDYLQLGHTAPGALPAQVPIGAGFDEISARYATTCVLAKGTAIYCWGSNDDGQVSATSGSSLPKLQSVTSPGAVTVGGHHVCAVAGGAVTCWGDAGLLPSGSKLTSGFMAVSAGSYHTCALSSGGDVLCWGDNNFYQLGRSDVHGSSTPSVVLKGANAISAGWNHTCARLTDDKTLVCWGDNHFGQLGNGVRSRTWSPVQITVQ